MRAWSAAGALAGVVSIVAAGAPGAVPSARAEDPPLAAVLLVEEGAGPDREAADALRAALLGPGRLAFSVSEISVARGDGRSVRDAVAEAVAEARALEPRVVVALGTAIAEEVAQTMRGSPVLAVMTGLRDPTPGRASPAVSGSWTADGGLAEELRRIVPGARRIGWVGQRPGADASSGLTVRSLALGSSDEAVGAAGDAADDATTRARRIREAFTHDVDAVWVGEDVPPDDVAAIARALAGTGLPLLGTRRDHLDVGAAVVVRCDPRDVGLLAAAAAAQLATTADPSAVTVRRVPSRRLREVHLGNARRLGFQVPLTLLAAADRVVPAPAVKR